jgi:hypothetical protein
MRPEQEVILELKYYYFCEITNKCVEVVVWFIHELQILPQHVSENHCQHHVVLFTSEATQASLMK